MVKFDPRTLTRGPWSTLVWGANRAVANRVLWALVSANDPAAHWLEIRTGEGDPSDREGPADLHWVPAHRLLVARELGSVVPQDAVANLALMTIIRADEPAHELLRLSDFLRLPSAAQDLISQLGSTAGARSIAISNTDRIREYFPRDPRQMRPVFDRFLEAHLHPFFSVVGQGTERRFASDFVFEVQGATLAHWKEGKLLCEQAPGDSPLSQGDSVPLKEVPEISAALQGTVAGADPERP